MATKGTLHWPFSSYLDIPDKQHSVEDCILVINIYFMSCVCLANYGASEAVYPCVVVEKIHEYF